jgi:3-deoxy-7-phosphoheptulonate synthase
VTDWSPTSWQQRPAAQQPSYPDAGDLGEAIERLSSLPPLVTSWEVERLKGELARGRARRAFLLQGGDCAESFDDCGPDIITAKLKILLQMSLVLVHATRKQVIRVGRIAGQYAKPRSPTPRAADGVTLPSYRGDLVNRSGFTTQDRTPDPELMLRGYERAALTLNFIRALSDGGFADLHHPEYWDLGFVQHSRAREDYERIVESPFATPSTSWSDRRRADRRTCGGSTSTPATRAWRSTTSRPRPARSRAAPAGTTCPPTCRGSACAPRSPTAPTSSTSAASATRSAVKIGPAMTAEWLSALLEVLDPDDEPGPLTLIHRWAPQGGRAARGCRPWSKRAARPSCGVCDPMHGNTETVGGGVKTRRFENILGELEQAFEIHRSMGTVLGGVTSSSPARTSPSVSAAPAA